MASVFEFLQSTGIATAAGNVMGTLLDICNTLLVLVLGIFLAVTGEEKQQTRKKVVRS